MSNIPNALKGLTKVSNTYTRVSGPRSPVASPKTNASNIPDALRGLELYKPNSPKKSPTVVLGGTKSKKSIEKRKTRTSEKVLVKGKERVVYVGPRGGKYIKSKGVFTSI